MDAKKVAMVIGVAVLLPLFLGLFVDAVYLEPKYENYCNSSVYPKYSSPEPSRDYSNCSYEYGSEYNSCTAEMGNPIMNYSGKCPVYQSCDYCQKSFNDASQQYNRNVFYILAPVGLVIVIIGIYLAVDYLGVGLMFAGLITLFYATMRTFSELSKLWRALIILIELLIIVWIGYKKIGDRNEEAKSKIGNNKESKKKRRK